MNPMIFMIKILVLNSMFIITSSYTSIQNTALSDIIFTRLEPSNDNVHSEYYFGKCANMDKVIVGHHHWTYEELKGKVVLRAFLDPVKKPPTCVYIKSESPYSESIRYHAFKFNICFCTIVYNYSGRVWRYLYYEWYIPVEMSKGLGWDLYFYKG